MECKKCNRVLPEGYRAKYCEYCRNQRIGKAREALKIAGGALALVGTVGISLITNGKIDITKKK